jgi:hypothetical protein
MMDTRRDRREFLTFSPTNLIPMAEQEVIKHTEKVLGIIKSEQQGFWHKTRELLTEILIIVFAVSISIWLHNWSEHRHEQREVKEFLLGLREDLKSDLTEIGNDSISYARTTWIMNYVVRNPAGSILSRDSLRLGIERIINDTRLNPNIGRYEGFKSAGKLGQIEDPKLQNAIVDFYQEDVPNLLLSENTFIDRKFELIKFIAYNRKRTPDGKDNMPEVLSSDTAQSMTAGLMFGEEILYRYKILRAKAELIIGMIEDQFPESRH